MKLRKAMNISFVLIPIIAFAIGIPVFRFIYTAKDINNTKKILQEAAYSGALAGTYALDIDSFQNGKERGRTTTIDNYPTDSKSGNPAAFMKQDSKKLRTKSSSGTTAVNPKDALGGALETTYSVNSNNLAATEIVEAVHEYMENSINMTADGNKAVYSRDSYSVAMKFERLDLKRNGSDETDNGAAPYNAVTVSVVLNYKPTMLEGLSLLFGDSIGDEIAIYGTSSAKTKTIF